MLNYIRKNTIGFLIIIATVVLGVIAAFTALRLYQLRNESVSPNAPSSRPGATAQNACQALTFTLATPPPSDECLQVEKTAKALSNCQEAEITVSARAICPPTTSRFPLDIMLVLDRSESMVGQQLTDAKGAAKHLIDQLSSSTDRVGLVAYNDTGTLRSVLTNDFTAVKTSIDGLTATGGTNIGDAVFKAQAELTAKKRTNAVPVMIVLSDGVANGRHSGSSCTVWPTTATACTNDAINQAATSKSAGTTIFTVGLDLDSVGQDRGIAVENLAREVLKDMASTQSKYFESPSSSQLTGIFDSIANSVDDTVATNVVIKDTLTSGITYASDSATLNPTSITGNSLTWNIGSMTANQSTSITFKVKLPNGTADQVTNVGSGSNVTYKNSQGVQKTVNLPLPKVSPISCTVSTPTPTPTNSPSPTPTKSPSPTPTKSPSPTPTASPTPTKSPSPTPTASPTPPGIGGVPTPTPTKSPSPTPTATTTVTTSTSSPTPIAAKTPSPTPRLAQTTPAPTDGATLPTAGSVTPTIIGLGAAFLLLLGAIAVLIL